MKYYAYYVDNEKGITNSWEECKEKIKGKKARYRKFNDKDIALYWLNNNFNIPLEDAIYFDSGTGAGEGTEIRVTDKNGNSLLNDTNIRGNINLKGYTNNYGELKALSLAIKIANEKTIKKIFGDSKLVLDYWSKGIFKSDLPEETRTLAQEVSKERSLFEMLGGKIEYISGDLNPADLGFHK